ncbi:PPOX class probable F420-dependent enzyme [Nocardia transvalensis]|uniref:PPOX class probable F420-dependent enzyme n=1 Tax=Nocardia transvalensis TaxID=37333 RepID=A0A7W9PC65_9NOCA|nr:TIGR03667 family PPOX class F420-dependent oxidoreductase [Nocardia transvalensis]MBB5912929.1 PPOX class probable F420-dependent enzyme [Nocardia transvalensis]
MTSTNNRPVVDPGTEFGAHVAERLRGETIGWLTTVGPSGTPQPNPVWFLWRGGEFLVFSQANQAKLRNIARNPRIALHLNSSEQGGEVAVLTGTARIDDGGPTPEEIADYSEKYAQGFVSIGMAPEKFYATYSTLIRITPDRLRGF